MSGLVPLKNPQISHPYQHPLRKSLHSLKDLYIGIFSQIVYEVNFAKNFRKFYVFLTENRTDNSGC